MASFLSIPRELRDAIIDLILWSSEPVCATTPRPDSSTDPCISDYDLTIPAIKTPPGFSLLCTNRQLHAEVRERAQSINVPLALHLSGTGTGRQFTWVTVPLRMGPMIECVSITIQAEPVPLADMRTYARHSPAQQPWNSKNGHMLERVVRHILRGGRKCSSPKSDIKRNMLIHRAIQAQLDDLKRPRRIPDLDILLGFGAELEAANRYWQKPANGKRTQNGKSKKKVPTKGHKPRHNGLPRRPERTMTRAYAGSTTRHVIKNLYIDFESLEETPDNPTYHTPCPAALGRGLKTT